MARRKKTHITPIPVPVDRGDAFELTRDSTDSLHTDAELLDAKRKGAKGVGAVVVHHTVTLLQILLILLLGAWAYVTYSQAQFFASPNAEERSALDPYAVQGQVLRLEYALSVYYALNQKYPVTLRSLVDDHMLDPSDLTYPGGIDRYRYQRFGEGFKLIVADEDTTETVTPADALIFDE